MDKTRTTFAEKMEQLRQAAAKVNREDISLEDMMQSYRDGIEAAKECLSMLGHAEKEADRLAKELETMMEGKE